MASRGNLVGALTRFTVHPPPQSIAGPRSCADHTAPEPASVLSVRSYKYYDHIRINVRLDYQAGHQKKRLWDSPGAGSERPNRRLIETQHTPFVQQAQGNYCTARNYPDIRMIRTGAKGLNASSVRKSALAVKSGSLLLFTLFFIAGGLAYWRFSCGNQARGIKPRAAERYKFERYRFERYRFERYRFER
jgi:hypothetical protein